MKHRTTENQGEVNNSSLYLEETDSKGVPLLKRIEKYPDLPEDKFIPIEYIHSNGLRVPGDIYHINKLGDVKNIKTGYIHTHSRAKNDDYLGISLTVNNRKLYPRLHRLIASTFLENPNPNVYKVVNHIDHNPENNNLSNLEWVTLAENNNKSSGKCSKISKDKLMSYIALDDQGNKLFKINKLDNKGYNVRNVSSSICNGVKYKGYYWKKFKLSKKEKALKLIGFSGNLDDYTWHEHWKYHGLYVCKEGFIKYNNRILCTIVRSGYICVSFDNKKSIRAHRLIMEFLLKRDLRKNEIVDHINTVRHDNSFFNLRVTDAKGNMSNPLTIEKIAKRIVLSDLYGNFIGYHLAREVYDFLGKNNIKRSRINYLLTVNIVEKKYICINLEDKEILYKKMGAVIYVFSNDKKTLLGAFSNLGEISEKFKLRENSIYSHIKSGKPLKTGEYILRGPEAVKLVLSLGHGTSGDYKPEK